MSQSGPLQSSSTSAGAVFKLTGNSGGAVPPDGTGNINVLGNNSTGINVVGMPGTFTLSIVGIGATTTQIGTIATATNAQAGAQSSSSNALTPSNITSLFSTNPLPATQGGTGVANPTAHTLPVAEGASNFNFLGPLTNGQLLVGSTGVDPVPATITAGAGISVTNGAGSITITAIGAGFAWNDNSGVFTAAKENGYFITATSTATLPAGPSEGDTIAFIVDTTQILTITANAGQKIRIGTALSAAAGTAANNARGDSIELVYRSTGTTWFALNAPEGTWTVT